MKSLKFLYKIGYGPSSSHTMGPGIIASYALEKYGSQKYFVELFGSLSHTGRGHGTDRVIKEILGEDTEIFFNYSKIRLEHPNTMDIYIKKDGCDELVVHALSVGGGSVIINGKNPEGEFEVYPQKTFDEIKEFCNLKNIGLYEYALYYDKGIENYLRTVWSVMKESVERGLAASGTLPGGLNLERKAKELINSSGTDEIPAMRESRKLSAYALAVAEENADNGKIATAPTCGSAGVLPSVLYYAYKDLGIKEDEIIKALAVAGIMGNVVKQNASISGAECGCQAEIGVACSMAAAALEQINGSDISVIECAAEIGLEHNLGLTCDPVLSLVQIPCIERNAMAAVKALSAATLAKSLERKHKISFDEIVKVMYETGKDMNAGYRETSMMGLAKLYEEKTK